MNQLHEDLLYVKSLVTAMGNLNQEEVQLRNQKQSPVFAQRRTVATPKQSKAGMIAILLLVFGVLFFINMLPTAVNSYQHEKVVIQLAKADDEFAWSHNHQGEPYPGYQGSEKVNMAKVLVPASIRGFIIAFIITGIVAAIMTNKRKRGDAGVERQNEQLQRQYEEAVQNNQAIAKKNAEIDAQIQQIANKRSLISEEYMQNIIEWYPRDYGYPSAVDFFINLVENHLATTIQECVEQYDTHMFRQKVTDNQQEMIDNQQVMLENQQIMISKQDEMIRQQMIGNTIATVNMMANIATARNTSQIAANTADIAHHTQNISEHTRRVANQYTKGVHLEKDLYTNSNLPK